MNFFLYYHFFLCFVASAIGWNSAVTKDFPLFQKVLVSHRFVIDHQRIPEAGSLALGPLPKIKIRNMAMKSTTEGERALERSGQSTLSCNWWYCQYSSDAPPSTNILLHLIIRILRSTKVYSPIVCEMYVNNNVCYLARKGATLLAVNR